MLISTTKTKNDITGGFFPIKQHSLEKLNDQNNNTIAPQTTASDACSTKIRNKKRIVKVRSDSRPISALYDIICKEKEICGPAATASTNSSTSSSNDLTKDIMSSVETKQQPTSSSHHLNHHQQHLQQPPQKLKYYHRTSPSSNGNFVENLENVPVVASGSGRFAGRLAKGEKRRHTDGNVQGTLFKLSTAKNAGSECDIISNEKHSLALSHSVNARSAVDAAANVPTTTGKR